MISEGFYRVQGLHLLLSWRDLYFLPFNTDTKYIKKKIYLHYISNIKAVTIEMIHGRQHCHNVMIHKLMKCAWNDS